MPENVGNFSKWKTRFLREHVQPTHSPDGGDFLSSETLVLVSGPAKPSLNNPDWLQKTVPIGLVQNAQVGQQKNIQQMFEIGSRRPFFVPGRTFISCSISRILFDGPSLMYALYMRQAADNGDLLNLDIPGWQPATSAFNPENPSEPITTASIENPDLSAKNPGLLFINLASSFFNYPLGLGFILFDNEQEAYGGFYLQECYIQTHSFGVAAQQTILVENVSIRASDMFPISVNAIGAGSTPNG